ncbi:MAG: ferrous iron transporter B, partial [Chitinispirillia bacterium]
MHTLNGILIDNPKINGNKNQNTLKIALVGNPNSGKTSIFNYLTGAHQRVGNWGGVTVDVKEGITKSENLKINLVDLPGTYSLSAYSIEEKVARDYVINERPDVVINVIDATNLERNLYLTLQLFELGIRPVLAFNMWDEVKNKKISIDIQKLEKFFGVPIVPTIGKSGRDVHKMVGIAVDHYKNDKKQSAPCSTTRFPKELSDALLIIASKETLKQQKRYSPDWIALKLMENDSQVEDYVSRLQNGESVLKEVDSFKKDIDSFLGDDPESIIAEARYGFISGALRESIRYDAKDKAEISDEIDNVLTHPVLAYPIFIAFLWFLFQATFTLGAYPMDWIDGFCGWL